MARDLSLTAREALLSQQTSEVFLILLEIDHSSLSDTLRFVYNNEQIVHNNATYEPYNFDIKMPSEEAGQISEVDLVLDNVDRSILKTIREIDTRPEITMKVVLASDPDTVEAGPYKYQLQDTNYDIQQISAKLGFPPVLDEPFPGTQYTPYNHPALS